MYENFTISFTPFGDWLEAVYRIRNLRPDIHASVIYGQRKVAEKFAKLVKDHLKNQDIPGWEQLRRPDRSSDPRALIDTQTYLENIKAFRVNFIYYVGVKKGVQNDRGIEISRIAAIHETWSVTGSGPYRPLWSYSWEEFGRKKKALSIIQAVVTKKLIARGW